MILAATGLAHEARILRGPGVRPIPGGGSSDALRAALMEAREDATGVISIGLAGALAPGLAAGDWVVAERVVWTDGAAETDLRWTTALAQRLSARLGVFLGSEAMLITARDKAEAGRRWGAVAVDMESHTAAAVAKELRIPFAAVRVISDAAHEDLPDAVRVGMSPDGRMAGGAVLMALLRRPGQVPALLRTATSAGRAFKALADGRRLLGPGLAFPDLGELALDVA
jgi:hopanoid-associated phosphorylase